MIIHSPPHWQEGPHLRRVRFVLQDDAPLGWKRNRHVLGKPACHQRCLCVQHCRESSKQSALLVSRISMEMRGLSF